MSEPPPLEPTGKIAPQAWMTRPETRAVIEALTAEGAEVRFVGGCVRDAVLKRDIGDIDIATPSPPETVIALLEAAGIKAVPTGIDHGTVTAAIGNRHYEITTLRVDVETHGRRATIAYTDDWIADAARRDFTINTLSCTPTGDVYDPFRGLDDLAHGVVKFVGHPRERIEEDYLRLLRFFRFYAAYGTPPPDRPALDACRMLAPKLSTLSAERIWSEFRRILLGPYPEDAVTLLRSEHVLEHILPEAGAVGRLRMLNWLETTAIKVTSVAPDAVRRLAALLQGQTIDTGAVASRFRLSNHETARLETMVNPGFPATPDLDERAFAKLLYDHGGETIRDILLLDWAEELSVAETRGSARTKAWLDRCAAIDSWDPPVFPLSGEDVIALGITPGPRVGTLLGAVETWWIEQNFQATREECLAELRSRAKVESPR